MAFAMPTSPSTSLLTYAEMDDQFTDVAGATAGAIGTTEGQRLARAAEAAYGEITSCLFRQGYTAAQVTSWFATSLGHAMHCYLSVYWWGSDSGLSRDHAVFADAERYRLIWEEICDRGGPIFDASGDLIVPDVDLIGESLQAKSSVQNNTLSERHNNRIDADPRQMLSGNASSIVGNTHYKNPGDPN